MFSGFVVVVVVGCDLFSLANNIHIWSIDVFFSFCVCLWLQFHYRWHIQFVVPTNFKWTNSVIFDIFLCRCFDSHDYTNSEIPAKFFFFSKVSNDIIVLHIYVSPCCTTQLIKNSVVLHWWWNNILLHRVWNENVLHLISSFFLCLSGSLNSQVN